MSEFGPVTRELAPGESNSIMASIKIENSACEDTTPQEQLPTMHPDFLFDNEMPKSPQGNPDSADNQAAQQFNIPERTSGRDGTDTDVPIDYSLMQEKLHDRFCHTAETSPQGPNGSCVVSQSTEDLSKSVIICERNLKRWKAVASAQGFTADSQTLEFLLNLFEEAKPKVRAAEPSQLCYSCQTPDPGVPDL